MTNVSDLGRRQHLMPTKVRSVDGPGEVGARNLTRWPITFCACSAYVQFTKKERWGYRLWTFPALIHRAF